jgi:hypothetical protein
MELEEMKKKWEILSQQIEKQNFINQKLIKDTVLGNVSRIFIFNSAGAFILLILILVVSTFPFTQWATISSIAILSFSLIWDCVNLYILSKVRSYKNTLCETEHYFLTFRKSETLNYCVQTLLLIPWTIIFVCQYIHYVHISQILLLALWVVVTWVISFFITKIYFKRVKEVQKGFEDLKSFMEDE